MKTLTIDPRPAVPGDRGRAGTPPGHRGTAVLWSDAFLGHDTGAHPENPGRLRAIHAELTRRDLLAGRPDVPFAGATDEQLGRVHGAAYLASLRALSRAGGGSLDPDTVVRPDSLAVARLASGAAIAAVDAVLGGVVPRAFVLVRPPGHHATPDRGMGFCLYNHVAVAAAHARAAGVGRVAIVDWDVHHGNGTQDAFYADGTVLYASMHQSPAYPGTGATRETGTGPGLGATVNLPLPPGTDDGTYLDAFDAVILPRLRAFRPELVLVSAGFDAHREDPLAALLLTEDGFAALAARVLAVAGDAAGGRLVAVLEGGYHPPALARSVVATLAVFDGMNAGGDDGGDGGGERGDGQ
ncbi:MAG: histone deacetylase [Chloroflexia bacterium]|nr:histone deacetylase [Chloroflexia bacterium]